MLSVQGFMGGGAENVGRIIIELKDIDVRKIDADGIIARLRKKLAVVPGAAVYLQSYQDIRVGGLFTASQYQFTLQGETLDELQTWAPRIDGPDQDSARPPRCDQRPARPRIAGRRLSLTAIPPRAWASSLNRSTRRYTTHSGSARSPRLYTQLNQYHVVMEVDPLYQNSPDAVQSLYVRSKSGAEVPLSAISHYRSKDDGPGGEPQRTISVRHDFVQSGPVPGAW